VNTVNIAGQMNKMSQQKKTASQESILYSDTCCIL